MLFNSIEFAVFLPVVFLGYWLVFARRLGSRNMFLLVASYVFYGWWDWRFLLLLIASSSVDFWVGRQLGRLTDEKLRRAVLMLSLAGNLGLLSAFKYFDFFVSSLEELLLGMGLEPHLWRFRLVLPVGLSFYTFQALSYTIDCYRRDIKPSEDPLEFLAFVAFFPQLVAGPIERARHMLPQFRRVAPFDEQLARDGARQIVWGLFKKMIVADNAARIADAVFDSYADKSGFELAAGAFFFAIQIYGDFSGYSEIAIGTAKLFGFRLMANFQNPYFSRDIAEFWRRWHISLTTWFRDYVYVPLGGSRVGRYRAARNVMIVFLLSGLWHGANWTFVAWGALNGLLFVPLLLGSKNRRYLDVVAAGRLLPTPKEAWQMLATFLAVTLAWVFFRSESISAALAYLGGMLDPARWALVPAIATLEAWLLTLALALAMLGMEWLQRGKEHALDLRAQPGWMRWSVYPALLVSFFLFGVFAGESFIYFQF
jgi:alginate O-acetyltransferase complex protein AlgI